MKAKKYDDDDGRIIADMSCLKFNNSPSIIKRNKQSEDFTNIDNGNTQYTNSVEMTKKEQLWFILGALKASLMIGMAYIVGLGAIIALIFIFG